MLGIREDAPEPPYLLLGFKEGVTRETFEQLYQAGDITAMEQCCHRIPAIPEKCFMWGRVCRTPSGPAVL